MNVDDLDNIEANTNKKWEKRKSKKTVGLFQYSNNKSTKWENRRVKSLNHTL